MDEILKKIADAMEDGCNVKVIKVNNHSDNDAKMVREARSMAHLNKVLYDAHIDEGFTEDQALAIVVATIEA